MLATSFHCVVSCIEFFSVLGNDFGGLWSQLRSGLYSGYVLYITFLGGIKAVSTGKWSLFESVVTWTGLTSLHPLPMHPPVKAFFASMEATDSTSSLPYPSVLLQFLSSSPW